jgi:hypothetical protein
LEEHVVSVERELMYGMSWWENLSLRSFTGYSRGILR